MSTTDPSILERLKRAKAPREKKVTAPLKKSVNPIAKRSRPIKGRSEKMKGVIAALRPLYDKFLAEHPDCEIQGPNCTGPAECVHHVEGRGIKVILDSSKWKASCRPCNSWVEVKDAEAKEKGHKSSRHKKPGAN